MKKEIMTWEILVIRIQKHHVGVLAQLDCGRKGISTCRIPDLFLITTATSFVNFLKGYIYHFLREQKQHTHKKGGSTCRDIKSIEPL